MNYYNPKTDSLPTDEKNLRWVYSMQQSMQFMIDMLSFIDDLNKDFSMSGELEVLDIGCATGAAANMLAQLNHTSFLGHAVKVDAMDIRDEFESRAEIFFPFINYMVDDIFEYNYHKYYDFIICSHCIEHFVDPTDFMNELIRRARKYVLFYAPYNEKNFITPGHVITITDEFVDSFNPILKQIITSRGWVHPNDDESKCIIFACAGKGLST